MSHLPFISDLLLVYFKTNTSQNEIVSNVLWHLHEKIKTLTVEHVRLKFSFKLATNVSETSDMLKLAFKRKREGMEQAIGLPQVQKSSNVR